MYIYIYIYYVYIYIYTYMYIDGGHQSDASRISTHGFLLFQDFES